MPADTGGWERSARLSGAATVAEVNRRHAAGLEYVADCEGGEVGACFVRRPDGRDGVLTRWGAGIADRYPVARRVVDRLRETGYPAPAYVAGLELDDGLAVLQDRVDGTVPAVATPGLVAAMIDLNQRQRDLFGTAEGSVAELHLLTDGAGFCLHEPMREYSPATRELLDWVEWVGRSTPVWVGAGRDAVHRDYHQLNVLVDRSDADRIAGVIDWTGAAVGDCGFDLVILGFSLSFQPPTGDAEALVRTALGRLEPLALRAFCASMALRQVDWMIRHHDDAAVQRWLAISAEWRDFAEQTAAAATSARSAPAQR